MKCVLIASGLVLAAFAWGCGDDGGGSDDGGRPDGEVVGCPEGAWRCSGVIAERCVGGVWGGARDCSESGQVCAPDLGCTDCIPGHTFCVGDDVYDCGDDGMTSTLVRSCDTASGEVCEEATGICVSPCRDAITSRSNIGCEYWAVDLDNAENSIDDAAARQFAVVVANLGNRYVADVFVEVDDGAPLEAHALRQVDYMSVAPGDLHIFRLPRWDVDGDNAPGVDNDPQTTLSRRVYRIRSTAPVVAYQFNPIEQAFSNSASVLLPTSGLDMQYSVVGWPPANPMAIAGFLDYPNHTYVTIVGVEDGTTIWVRPTYDVMEGVGQGTHILPVPPFTAGEEYEILLDQFDVLNLQARAMRNLRDELPDLTGTTVRSSRPVAVFTGVDLASVGGRTLPDGSTDACCAEHMEAQIPPTTALGHRFVVSRSPTRSSGSFREWDHYRVFAVVDGTNVATTDSTAGSFTLNAGEWMEFGTERGFVLTTQDADHPVHVVQFLTARDQVYEWRPSAGGDPDMMYVPPVEQRRTTYIFTTGERFSENWAVISMPEGASATLDGVDVAGSCRSPLTDGSLEGTTFRAYYCPISDGRHEVEADNPQVGVIVYGYYNAGSYAYPAGAELRRIFLG
jgi:hypothetical protein